METLSPRQAAVIASGVYLLRDATVTESIDRGRRFGTEGLFSVREDGRFSGQSGTLIFTKITGFGYVAAGENEFADHVLVATRGTAIGVDWLSNLNIGSERGPSGLQVHAGFNKVWKSYREALRPWVSGRNIKGVHCVGHSLGGALAALNADYFSSATGAPVSLYTFGSPRAGFAEFGNSLTRRLTADRIFRVSHLADPVPLIPVYPYRHVPSDTPGYVLDNGGSLRLRIDAHSMEDSYIPGVGERAWIDLTREGRGMLDGDVQRWLGAMAPSEGPAMYSAQFLGVIATALQWIIKRALNVGRFAELIGETVLDQIVRLLSNGIKLSVELASYVTTLIGAIFRFLGRAAYRAGEVTSQFLRWVLNLLWDRLKTTAGMALSAVGLG